MYGIEEMFREKKLLAANAAGSHPVNMPNPEVKPASVDGTVRGTYGRADRCQFRLHGEEVQLFGLPLFFILML